MNAIQLPPVPSWDGLHPLVVHFPIALLLTVPLFLIAAMAMRQRGRWLAVAALVLMVVGTGFAFVAAESGEAAAQLVEPGDAVQTVLERHEHLADITTTLFASLTAAYAVLLLAQWWFPKLGATRVHLPLHAAFLLAFIAATVVLANTAHQGGTLVHQFGVRALMAPNTGTHDRSPVVTARPPKLIPRAPKLNFDLPSTKSLNMRQAHWPILRLTGLPIAFISLVLPDGTH